VQPLPVVPPPTPPLTPGQANTFIQTVAQTREQVVAAAVHAARTAFEAIPTAQDGDVIDAAIPNAFRSAMITLFSLADATVQQFLQRQPTPVAQPPVPLPPIMLPPVTTTPPIVFTPPVGINPGILHIDPSMLTAVQPAVPTPGPDPTAGTPIAGSGVASVAPVSLPTLDLGGQIFQPETVTHPETGLATTVFMPVAAAGAPTATLAPVSGGGFHLTPAAGTMTAVDSANLAVAGTSVAAPTGGLAIN
jgi:hypothetical protein